MSSWYQQQQSEAAFMGQVTDYARLKGWDWFHVQPGLTERGRYRTPVSGTLGAGWPDLILVRQDRIIAAELKSARGTVTALQKRVMTVLQGALLEVHVWRPRDWALIEQLLA